MKFRRGYKITSGPLQSEWALKGEKYGCGKMRKGKKKRQKKW